MVVDPEKSSSIPCQVLVILGFIINSSTKTIQVTTEKTVGLKTVWVAFASYRLICKGSSKCDLKDSGYFSWGNVRALVGYVFDFLPTPLAFLSTNH